ncbi:methyltransferase domain-containing protein [Kitasatospora sp. NBC_00240]|uniref:class I SAM-dependent methyltransferase n=1 Tax=Kitasatospora sp. NBC_00240 TaxID=2903567 RepID=UPI00225B3149|nr:class I SAM-dependent methyltransferase [Kitasatospora sp. NBC_00240]MCX5214651.1 methyltransferase domain-containing protein [Kitasatospora sp. NBC_00240]
MSASERYARAWEGYWAESKGEPGEPFWDADATLTAAPHTELFAPHVDRTLPVVDLGCGNGTQTRYLAGHFPRAVGVDLSASAVAHARRADRDAVAEFEQLDLADLVGVRRLGDRLGEANVYMRAVLHQSDPADRAPVAAAVALVLGRRGRGFVVEPTAAAKAVLQQVADGPDGPPERLRQVRKHRLRPAEVAPGELPALLGGAGLAILDQGETGLAMSQRHPDGTRVALPAQWFVVAAAGGSRPGG